MRLFTALAAALVFLSSCGKVFCVGPIGPVDQCYAAPQSGTTTGTTSTNISIVRPTALVGQPIPRSTPITLTAANGSGTYTWQITSSSGTAGTLSAGSGGGGGPSIFTGGTVTYTPPSGTGSTTVQLSDSNAHSTVDSLATQ
jgi:hypothetical protein